MTETIGVRVLKKRGCAAVYLALAMQMNDVLVTLDTGSSLNEGQPWR